MKESEFEKQDPTSAIRNELAEALVGSTKNEDEKNSLEFFRKGTFMIPSKTFRDVSILVDKIEDKEKRESLQTMLGKILEEKI